jgi:hypothetical protein
VAAKTRAELAEERLITTIERVERSYYISQFDGRGRAPPQDEALTTLHAKVVQISSRHKAYIGSGLEVTLGCARGDGRGGVDPFLLPVNLRGVELRTMACLPQDASDAIPVS